MLEIAPGRGRWTSYLRGYCDRLAIVDLDEACIAACRQRFEGDDRITYHVNDGMSLAMIDDESVDLAFSFDSLVHANAEVLASYLRGSRGRSVRTVSGSSTIRTQGVIGATSNFRKESRAAARARLYALRLLDRPGWRALDMTAERFRESCAAAGSSASHRRSSTGTRAA